MTAADVAPFVLPVLALAVSCWSLREARRSYLAASRAARAAEDAERLRTGQQ